MASAPLTSPSISRPRSVTIVAVGVFLLGLVNIYRAIILFQHSGLQLDLGVRLDPRARMILAAIWSIVLIVMAIILWLRIPGARVGVPLLLLLYAINRLALVGIFAESTYVRGSQILSIILYGISIAFASWALNRKGSRAYFAKEKEGKSSDSTPAL
jgi:hypothetical protein